MLELLKKISSNQNILIGLMISCGILLAVDTAFMVHMFIKLMDILKKCPIIH